MIFARYLILSLSESLEEEWADEAPSTSKALGNQMVKSITEGLKCFHNNIDVREEIEFIREDGSRMGDIDLYVKPGNGAIKVSTLLPRTSRWYPDLQDALMDEAFVEVKRSCDASS